MVEKAKQKTGAEAHLLILSIHGPSATNRDNRLDNLLENRPEFPHAHHGLHLRPQSEVLRMVRIAPVSPQQNRPDHTHPSGQQPRMDLVVVPPPVSPERATAKEEEKAVKEARVKEAEATVARLRSKFFETHRGETHKGDAGRNLENFS